MMSKRARQQNEHALSDSSDGSSEDELLATGNHLPSTSKTSPDNASPKAKIMKVLDSNPGPSSSRCKTPSKVAVMSSPLWSLTGDHSNVSDKSSLSERTNQSCQDVELNSSSDDDDGPCTGIPCDVWSPPVSPSHVRPPEKPRTPPKEAKPFNWRLGLRGIVDYEPAHLSSDELCVVIKDKYPKARYHYLILPRQHIPNLKALKRGDLELLRHMEKVARTTIQMRAPPEIRFNIGYHVIPSMSHLHLHVISRDFDSPCMKTKKHWNSFNTGYFVHSHELTANMASAGPFLPYANAKALLDTPLRCHVCIEEFKTMPALKTHILKHFNPKRKTTMDDEQEFCRRARYTLSKH